MKGMPDKRLTDLVKERKIHYSQLAQSLRLKGHDVTANDVFNIARRKKKASKQMQQDIADILGCLRKDIF